MIISKNKIIPIDYEYANSKNKFMDVVSVAYEIDGNKESRWLYKDLLAQQDHRNLILDLHNSDYVFLSFNAQAEMRAMLSCGINKKVPIKFLDLFLEYRAITNHNDSLMWGKQLIDGKKITTVRPKYGAESKENNSKPQHNLASACYKLLDVIVDTEHKTEMRDLIISAPEEFTQKEQDSILEYGMSDIKYLFRLFDRIKKEYAFLYRIDLDPETLQEEMLFRGDYARRSAIMETLGYPINYEATKNFSNSVEDILSDVARDIIKKFPEIKPFSFDSKKGRYKTNTKPIKKWISESKFKNKWLLTPKGDYSLAKDAFTKHFNYTHIYPEGNFGAQIVRYLKTKQNLNGFRPSLSGKKTFWSSVGSDQRVRAYLNPYGTQTARNASAATGFIPLKAAWMRSLIQPNEGRSIASCDWSSCEFLISALLSKDLKMVEAYNSGDVYLHFAKSIGLIPQDGTKESHPKERQLCKNTVLGISYSMTYIGLTAKLRMDMDDDSISEDYCKGLINKFNRTYPKFYKWKQEMTGSKGYVETEDGSKVWQNRRGLYQKQKYLKLPCGWPMFGDNDNLRSVGNFPVQGCIEGTHRVLSRELGYQKLEDIPNNINFHVWEGEKFVNAQKVYSGKKQKVKITFFNGQEITCSPNHKFLTVSPKNTTRWRKPSEFCHREAVVFTNEVEEFTSDIWFEDCFSSQETNRCTLNSLKDNHFDLGLILGRLASDGHVTKKGGCCIWTVAEHEKEIIPILKNILLKITSNIKEHIILRPDQNKQPIHELRIYSKNLNRQIKELNLNKSITHTTLWKSKELLRGFLKGYVDGDGGVIRDNKSAKISVRVVFGKGEQRAKHAEDLFKIFAVFGIDAQIRKYPSRTTVKLGHESSHKFRRQIGFINEKKNKKIDDTKDSTRCGKSRKECVIVKTVEVTTDQIDMYDIVNCPDQKFMTDGLVVHNTGSSAMRMAVTFAQDVGLDVIFTLHDAVYIEYDSFDFESITKLRKAMFDGFVYYFSEDMKEHAKSIRTDAETWSPDYVFEDNEVILSDGSTCKVEEIHIDDRNVDEYNQFKKYFKKDEDIECL